MTIHVSIVVPTCRRPEPLERCLRALCAQAFDPSRYEVIVVDDAGCDLTRRLVERHVERAGGRSPAIRYLRTTGRRGPAAARNVGWRAARGAIVAFTDDDCLPEPAWLLTGSAAFVDGVVGAAGTVLVPLPDNPTDYERSYEGLGRSEFVTANCFYRRDALAAIGGFDERFTAPWREDSDLFFTLLERGSRLVDAPSAVVVHPVGPAPWGSSLAQQRKSMFNALLYKKHPILYRRRLRPVTPWHYYAIVAALAGVFAGALRGSPRLAGGASLIWAALTARFCAQRLRNTSRAPRHVAEMIVTSALIPPLAIFWRLLGALKFRVLFM